MQKPLPTSSASASLTVAAMGVVYGDIGTSPIYTLQTVFNPDDPPRRVRLVRFDGVGHFPELENPAAFIRELDQFLNPEHAS